MKKNKAVSVILNIIIVILVILTFLSFIEMSGSFKYRKEQLKKYTEDDYTHVMEYELDNKAYNEILSTYYTYRAIYYEPVEKYVYNYKISEYCHQSFLNKIYEANNDQSKLAFSKDRLKTLEGELGKYSYIVNDVEDVLSAY